jgi:hypothetical protein
MIFLPNKDRKIFDLEYRVADIISEYQSNGYIVINLDNEGICLESVGFYKLLDYVCDKFAIDKSKITIHTTNQLEKHQEYNVNVFSDHWFVRTKVNIPQEYLATKTTQLKTLGCFIGKINWHRLVLLSWLYNNYSSQCLLTCHYRYEDAQKLNSELTELNFYMSSELDSINFLKYCPLTLDEEFREFTIGSPEHLNILKHYDKIFLDLVVETYVLGNTFFPTEKTLRPIIARTPFIVMGPKNYLANLKSLGFQTFDRWWNEDYDAYEGPNRVNEIKKRLEVIFSWPQEKIQNMLVEMQEVLEHNYNHYMNTNYDNQK